MPDTYTIMFAHTTLSAKNNVLMRCLRAVAGYKSFQNGVIVDFRINLDILELSEGTPIPDYQDVRRDSEIARTKAV